jgi:hypothetical protein
MISFGAEKTRFEWCQAKPEAGFMPCGIRELFGKVWLDVWFILPCADHVKRQIFVESYRPLE